MPGGEARDDLLDDEDERFLEQWAEAERHAAGVVAQALAGERGKQPPATIGAAAAEVRAAIRAQRQPVFWVARAAALGAAPPSDDAELLLECAAATISPKEETGLDSEEESMLLSLEMADWAAGAVIELVRDGAGAHCRSRDLVAAIDRCPEIDGTTAGEDIGLVEAALSTVQLAWIGLGLIDRDDRLTDVGAWVLPRALTRAWGVDFDDSGASA